MPDHPTAPDRWPPPMAGARTLRSVTTLPPPSAMTRCPHGRIICAACAATLDEPAGGPHVDDLTLARLDTLDATMLAVIGQIADLRRLLGVE